MNSKKILSLLILIIVISMQFLGTTQSLADSEEEGLAKKIVNLGVSVRFADTVKVQDNSTLVDAVFNKEETGLKNFIYANSNGNVDVDTQIIAEIQIDKPSSYFMPKYKYNDRTSRYDTTKNVDGYDNRYYADDGSLVAPRTGKINVEYVLREQEFARLVAEGLKDIDLPDGCDSDDNTAIDSLTFLLCDPVDFDNSNEDLWNTIFWPHMSNYYYGTVEDLAKAYYVDKGTTGSFDRLEIDGKLPLYYLVMPYDALKEGKRLNSSVICHEFMHILGSSDYYYYDSSKGTPVGEFDVMGTTTKIPQLSLSYLRYKMGWLSEGEDILAIEESGRFTLFPTETTYSGAKNQGEVKAYKIVLSDYFDTGECFYIEYRSDEISPFGSGLPDKGLIIYRVNEDNAYINSSGEKGNYDYGNMYGDNEIYIYRYWGKTSLLGNKYEPRSDITINGICYATISDKEMCSSYGSQDGTRNVVTYSNGTNSKISLSFVSYNDDGSITFDVSIPEKDGEIGDLSTYTGVYDARGGKKYIRWNSQARVGNAYILIADREISSASAENIVNGICRYGETVKIPVSFQKYTLPKFNADEGSKYIYLVIEKNGSYSIVKQFVIEGTNDPVNRNVIIAIFITTFAIGGISIMAGILGLIIRRKVK